MEKSDYTSDIRFMQNREISWLRFNERVLQEAQDQEMPLFERLNFVSIFSSNLDEFFMIRVGSLVDLTSTESGSVAVDNKSGMTAQEQLDAIYKATRPLYEERDRTYIEIKKLLDANNIRHLTLSELTDPENEYMLEHFKRYILPVLSPQIVDNHHPFPFTPNKKPYIAFQLQHKEKDLLGLIPVPDTVPELIFLPGEEVRFVPSVKVIAAYGSRIFDMYKVKNKSVFYVTRNADISIEDRDVEMVGDFRAAMKKMLKKRRTLEIVRVEFEQKISGWLKETLSEKLKVRQEQMFISKTPISMNFASHISAILDDKRKSQFYYKPFIPQPSPDILPNESIIAQVRREDKLLSHPYESMESFLRLVQEASEDDNVVSIKITIYRLAQKPKLVESLCTAAENGKEVVVLIELRARFDEQNNINWSEMLEEAGCRLIYGIGEYKVHSKVCLITRKTNDDYMYITQVGTGNYNEKTTELYTDYSLLTANQEIGVDASNFFKNMTISNLSGDYKHLMVAPNSMKTNIIALIEEEIEKKENGRIGIKINSISDYDIIQKLMEASCAGVKVDMIVRGICCLLPGVPGKTENISIISIVGRFLEHSRIFRFGEGADQKLFISSADLMTRNMQRRVEVACPIYSEAIRDKINMMFDSMFYDTEKARVLQPDGTLKRKQDNRRKVNVQEIFIEEARLKAARRQTKRERTFRNKMLSLITYSLKGIDKAIRRLDGMIKNGSNLPK